MSDRPLLEGLAEVAREQRAEEREDPELAARLKGELSPEAAAALEARLDPLDAALFQPISADRKAELMRKARAQLEAAEPASAAAAGVEVGELARPANVVALSPRRWPLFLAIAASAVIAVFGARQFMSSPEALALPKYALAISSGAQQARAEVAPSDEAPVFAPNTTVQLILRPAEAVRGAVAFRAFLKRGDQLTLWSPPSAIDPGGSIIIEGQASELLKVERGAWTIVVVLARPEAIERAAKEAASGRPPAAGVEVLEQKIVVAD